MQIIVLHPLILAYHINISQMSENDIPHNNCSPCPILETLKYSLQSFSPPSHWLLDTGWSMLATKLTLGSSQRNEQWLSSSNFILFLFLFFLINFLVIDIVKQYHLCGSSKQPSTMLDLLL